MQRLGRTHRPFYRINAIDGRVKRNGVIIENLGWYNPVESDPEKQIELKPDRIKEWLDKGAQPSDTMMDILGNRDMLPEKMKAAWEAKRTTDRQRGECKKAVKAIEAIVADLEKLAGEAEIDAHLNNAKKQLNNARNSVAAALVERAEAAVAEANKAADEAKKAAAAAKPAEEEAPAEAEASTEGESEG